jgi:hypothetical protein
MVSHKMLAFYSIGQKMMVWIVFERLKNIRNVKRYNTFLSRRNALFLLLKLGKWFRTKCIHCIALDPKSFLRVFWNIRQPSTCQKMQTLCFGRECTISRYQNCDIPHKMHSV